jgi:hypothetical protein
MDLRNRHGKSGRCQQELEKATCQRQLPGRYMERTVHKSASADKRQGSVLSVTYLPLLISPVLSHIPQLLSGCRRILMVMALNAL